MAHKTVVRNKAYQLKSFTTVERHNERKNDEYFNGDVELERAKLNVYYKRNFNEHGEVETYHETFNRLLAEKKTVLHGTKPDAKLFCELVYDINTSYFDERGGYEFAKSYFEEAYRQAVKEIGSEDYIISAVMHADERNSRLSEQLGRDIYHYHLHVVYVPVVQKELRFRKNHKDPELAGKVKEVIPQISQSNKWPLRQQGERDGKAVTLNSYSFLQDRYYEHMKTAGFEGFDRGERGSTTEHLEVLDYKIQQDRKHAAALEQEIEEKQKTITDKDNEIEDKEKTSANLSSKIQKQENAAADNEKKLADGKQLLTDIRSKVKSYKGKVLTMEQIENIPVKISKPMLGGVESATMPKKDWDNIKKTALTQAQTTEEYQVALSENDNLKKQRAKLRKEKQGLEGKVSELEDSTKEKFLERATKDAELRNLKNDVAKIPADVWKMYTNPKAWQREQQKLQGKQSNQINYGQGER